MPNINSSDNLNRLARFGANIADAFGCYIFLPRYLTGSDHSHSSAEQLFLAGYHSLSNDVIKNCEITPGSGLVGWVAKHRRSIHVSPFERDSRTLGFYGTDQILKSLIGIPIFLDGCNNNDHPNREPIAGAVGCDSKKSFAFSKLQGKLLEDLACEISNNLRMSYVLSQTSTHKNSWQRFLLRGNELSESLGRDSIEVARLNVINFHELENSLGTARTISIVEQIYRLVEQALPPHFPNYRPPNGELVVVIDNMMTAFIENKLDALCEHCAVSLSARPSQTNTAQSSKIRVKFGVTKCAASNKKYRSLSLEDLIHATSGQNNKDVVNPNNIVNDALNSSKNSGLGLVYEYKRA